MSVTLEEIDLQKWIQNGKGANDGGMIGLYIEANYADENLVVYNPDYNTLVNLILL